MSSIKLRLTGRPRKHKDKLEAILGVSISREDKALVERAATKKFPNASSLSEAMRIVLIGWARRVLDETA